MESSHDLGSFLSDVRWMELNGVSIHFNILIFFFFFCLRLGSFRADYKYLSIVFLSWISSFPDLQGPSTCFGKRWKNNISAHFYAEHRNVREFFPKKKQQEETHHQRTSLDMENICCCCCLFYIMVLLFVKQQNWDLNPLHVQLTFTNRQPEHRKVRKFLFIYLFYIQKFVAPSAQKLSLN